MADTIKVLSCNVRGLADSIKRRQLFNYIHRVKADIVLMQETHCTKNKEKIFKAQLGYKMIFDNGESNARGVCIAFAPHMQIEKLVVTKSNQGRYIILNFVYETKEFVIACIYAPNEDKPEFFTKVFEELAVADAEYKIIGGDLNVWLDVEKDHFSKSGQHQKVSNAAAVINNYLEEQNWVDAWRAMYPEIVGFTWRRRKPMTFLRIDYFLMSVNMMSKVNSLEILPGLLSDHSFLAMEFSFTNLIKGQGYWHLNTALLNEKEYVDLINKEIDFGEYRYDNLNRGLKWEMVKQDITDASQWYSI